MKWLIKLLFLFLPIAGNAYQEDGQQWLSLSAQGLIVKSNFGGYFEAQARRSDRQEKVYEYLIRPAVYYKSESSGSFFVGQLKRFDYASKENENRYWVQWLKTFDAENLKITSRFRQEYREIKTIDEISQRSRLLLKGVWDKFPVGYDWKPFLASEIFYNWNDAGPIKKGLQQSRNSIGLGKSVTSTLFLEAFYMAQIINNPAREDQLNHNLVLSLNFGL